MPHPLPRSRSPGAALVTLVIVAALAGPAGCRTAGAPLRGPLHDETLRPNPGVVIFLVDALPAHDVAAGCAEGWLPNIRDRLWRRGTRVTNAMAAVPSITYASIASLLTGTTAAQHGVLGNHWFDRDAALFRNYLTIDTYRSVNDDFDAPSLYEQLRGEPTASIQAAHARGATGDFPNWAYSGVMWFLKDYTAVDKRTASTLPRIASWANRRGSWPTVLTCYFPGADSVGHEHGPHSAEFRAAITHVDFQIGRICDYLEREGLFDTTYLVLVSDHGLEEVSEHTRIDLRTPLRRTWGRAVTDRMLQDGSLASRRAYFNKYDTVLVHQDGRVAFLHLRGPDGWGSRPTPEEVARIVHGVPTDAQLWNVGGVDFVAYYESEDRVAVHQGGKRASIRIRTGPAGDEFAYDPTPDDVLNYTQDPTLAAFIAAGFHDSRAWLDATCEHEIPDFVPRIPPLLHNRRAGEVVIFAAPGYSLNGERGGHGGVRRHEQTITLVVAGPGIPAGSEVPCARAEDLVPTVLELLARQPRSPAWLEGRPLPLPTPPEY